MKKKRFKQSIVSVLLILCIVVSGLYNGDIVKADESSITLDIAAGPITIADMVYTQKTSAGTVVATGTVSDEAELILTGSQTSSYSITISGSSHPAIRMKNIYTNGNFRGPSATGTLNLIVDGTCTFLNNVTALNSSADSLKSLTAVNVSGENNGELKGTYGLSSLTSAILTVSNLKLNGSATGTYNYFSLDCGIRIYNCTQVNGNLSLATDSSVYETSPKTDFILKDSVFESLSVQCFNSLTIDNCIVNDGGCLSSGRYNGTPVSSCTIKDSYLSTGYLGFWTNNTTITNSYIYGDTGISWGGGGVFNGYQTIKVVGSTLEDNASTTTSYNDFGLMSASYRVFMADSALIFKGALTTSKHRLAYGTTVMDYYDLEGQVLYLNKLLVPNTVNSKVTVSIDGHTPVNLWTDSAGYLFLYLPTGSHEVSVTDMEEKHYSLNFEGAASRETATNSNVIGTLEETGVPLTITFTPYANTNIEYSFNKTKWYNAATDENCNFQVIFPQNSSLIYLRFNGVLYSAAYENGTIGTIAEAIPNIISTSSSPTYFTLGQNGTLFVYAEPVYDNDSLNYQWSKDGNEIEGADNSVLTITNIQDSDFGDYTCKISEENVGAVTSTPISVLKGKEYTGELKILSQSEDKNLIVGYSADLFCVGNSEDISYQWFRNGISLEEAVNPILHINPTVTEAAIYTCILTKDEQTLDSQPINVLVTENPLTDELANLNQITNDLTDQVNTITEQLEAANKEKQELHETVTDLENQITDLTGQESDLQSQIDALKGALEDSQEYNDALIQVMQNLNEQINSLNDHIESLQSDLKSANEQKTILELTIIDLMNDINNLNSQISLLENQLNDKEEENSGLLEQAGVLQDTIKNLQNSIAELNIQVDSITTENNSLHNQLDSANGTIQDLQEQLTALIRENASLLEQLAYAQAQINELTDELLAEQRKNSDLNDKLGKVLDELTEVASQLGAPTSDQQDILESIKSLKDEIDSLRSQLQDSNNTIENLNSQILYLTETAAALQIKIDAAMDCLSEYEGQELQGKISSIINRNKELSGYISELEERNSTLLEQTSLMNDTISNLLKQIGGLEEDNSNLAAELNQAEDTIDFLQEQLEEQISRNNQLQNQLIDLVANMDDLKEQLSNTNINKEGLLYQINTLQADINTLTQQINDSNDIIVNLNRQIENMNSIIQNLQDQINKALDSLSDYEGADLKEKIDDILEKQAGLMSDFENARDLNNNLNQQLVNASGQLSNLQAEIDRLTGVLEDKAAEIERLNSLLQQQNSENARLVSRDAELENENHNLKEMNAQLKNQINQGNQSNEELQQVIIQLSEKEKELAAANAAIEALKKQSENNSSGSAGNTGNAINDDVYVVVPETSTSNNIKEIVKDTVFSDSGANTIESNSGWELSGSLSAEAVWGDTLQPFQYSAYTGVFTFFNNRLNSGEIQTLSENLIGKAELLSLTVSGVGLQEKKLISDSGGDYVKYTFYARRVNDKNKVYVCEVNVAKTDYTTPDTSLSSSILSDPRNYTPQNTYTTKVNGKVVFRVSADYGTIGKESVKYQVVPEDEDFDPDGGWIEVSGETFTVPDQKENYRVYIKYTDKAGNFTVDKTVGFNVGTDNITETAPGKVTQSSVPVFEIGKTIELGSSYKINLANISKEAEITFSSSNNKVATVSKTGVIISRSLGNAVVSGSVEDEDYTYKFIMEVSVVKGIYNSTLNLKQISTINSIDGKPVVVIYKLCNKGEAIKLNMLDSTDAQITYKSSNEKIAAVSKEGKVTGKNKGRANIIVTVTQDGITYTYMVIVRVTDGTDDGEMWDYLTEQ